jgi:hypothetical protein
MPDAADEVLAIGQIDRLSSGRKTVLTNRKTSIGNSLPSSIVPVAGAAKGSKAYLHGAIKACAHITFSLFRACYGCWYSP